MFDDDDVTNRDADDREFQGHGDGRVTWVDALNQWVKDKVRINFTQSVVAY